MGGKCYKEKPWRAMRTRDRPNLETIKGFPKELSHEHRLQGCKGIRQTKVGKRKH